MTIKSLALASLVLAASLGAAQAESGEQNNTVSIEQRLGATAAPVVEGRQAATIATVKLSGAEKAIIDHNADTNR